MIAKPRIVLSLVGFGLALPDIALAHSGHGAPPAHLHPTPASLLLALLVVLLGALRLALLRRASRRVSG